MITPTTSAPYFNYVRPSSSFDTHTTSASPLSPGSCELSVKPVLQSQTASACLGTAVDAPAHRTRLPRKRCAFLAIHTSSYFTTLSDVGRMLQRSGQYAPLFLFLQAYPTLDNDVRALRAEGMEFLLPGAPRPLEELRGAWTRLMDGHVTAFGQLCSGVLMRGIRRLGRAVNHVLAKNTLYHVWRLFVRRWTLLRLFRRHRVDLVILGGDLTHYDTAVFIQAAHRVGIPAVVVPAWMASAREAAEAYKYDPVYSADQWFNALVAWMYPRWVYEHKGRRLLRLPGEQVLAREWLGLAPPLPWILHSGYADAIAVESEAMREYGIREGLDPASLVVTGSATHDRMASILLNASTRRADLYDHLHLCASKPLLLCALPPDFLSGVGGRPECEFRTYDDLVRFWMEVLASVQTYNIVLALHPSIPTTEMRHVEKWGVKIADEATADLVPVCDLYVASISATIQWAIACGKPVINYDVYRYHYTDYEGVEAVVTMDEAEQFRAVLKRITIDREYYRTLADRQRAAAGYWGQLDGRASMRLLQLFCQVKARYG